MSALAGFLYFIWIGIPRLFFWVLSDRKQESEIGKYEYAWRHKSWESFRMKYVSYWRVLFALLFAFPIRLFGRIPFFYSSSWYGEKSIEIFFSIAFVIVFALMLDDTIYLKNLPHPKFKLKEYLKIVRISVVVEKWTDQLHIFIKENRWSEAINWLERKRDNNRTTISNTRNNIKQLRDLMDSNEFSEKLTSLGVLIEGDSNINKFQGFASRKQGVINSYNQLIDPVDGVIDQFPISNKILFPELIVEVDFKENIDISKPKINQWISDILPLENLEHFLEIFASLKFRLFSTKYSDAYNSKFLSDNDRKLFDWASEYQVNTDNISRNLIEPFHESIFRIDNTLKTYSESFKLELLQYFKISAIIDVNTLSKLARTLVAIKLLNVQNQFQSRGERFIKTLDNLITMINSHVNSDVDLNDMEYLEFIEEIKSLFTNPEILSSVYEGYVAPSHENFANMIIQLQTIFIKYYQEILDQYELNIEQIEQSVDNIF